MRSAFGNLVAQRLASDAGRHGASGATPPDARCWRALAASWWSSPRST
jgi:hypothetical protein